MFVFLRWKIGTNLLKFRSKIVNYLFWNRTNKYMAAEFETSNDGVSYNNYHTRCTKFDISISIYFHSGAKIFILIQTKRELYFPEGPSLFRTELAFILSIKNWRKKIKDIKVKRIAQSQLLFVSSPAEQQPLLKFLRSLSNLW